MGKLNKKLNKYILTFGKKYAVKQHPIIPHLHSDGYVEILADSYKSAKHFVKAVFNTYFDELVVAEEFEEYKYLYPLGSMKALIVPTDGTFNVGDIIEELRNGYWKIA